MAVTISLNGLMAGAASAAESAGDMSTPALVDRALVAVGQGDRTDLGWTAPDDPTAPPGLSTTSGTVSVMPVSSENSLVQVSAGEVQAVTVLRDGADTTAFSLDLPDGFQAVPRGTGFDIVALAPDAGSITAGHIDAPWAVDAHGRTIPTRFSIDGHTLTQTIDPREAAFPVVVDPLVTFGLGNAAQGIGFYVNLLGSQMRAIAAAAAFLGAAGAATLCAGSSKIPSGVRWFIIAGCAAFGAPRLGDIISFVSRAYKAGSYGFSTCHQTRVEGDRPWVRTDHANCE
ncbi:hypothetical protein [Clavibacter sp. Sh2088]|uniref:hypothetical protein n=1 Tax=Clavibacter sp. Sh2088 TaxID=3397676 RepID=UPI0039E12B52